MLRVYDYIYAFREIKCKQEDFERALAFVSRKPMFTYF